MVLKSKITIAGKALSTCQPPSFKPKSLGEIEIFGERASLNDFLSYNVVCRTTPATQGTLETKRGSPYVQKLVCANPPPC